MNEIDKAAKYEGTLMYHFLHKHERVIGIIGTILAIIMFGALLEIFISNVSGATNLFIQPLATAVNCFIWTGYGIGRKDIFIIIPNAVGFILGVITTIAAFV